MIGLDSPVTELSSKTEWPEIMVPSIGGVEPVGTRTTSPISKRSTGIFRTLEPGFRLYSSVSASTVPFSMSSLTLRKQVAGLCLSAKPTTSASAGFKLARLVMASPVRLLL